MTGLDRRVLLALIATLALTVAISPAHAAKRDISYVADRSGTIWSHPTGGTVNQIKRVAKGKPFVDPTGIEADTDGTLVIADPGARAIFRLDPVDGDVERIAKGAPLSTPIDLDIAPSGRIQVLDTSAAPDGLGAVVEVTKSGATSVHDPAGQFRLRGATSMVLADARTAYIADGRADASGIVFRLDLATGAMTLTAYSEGLVEPQGIDLGSDGFLYVTDQGDEPMDPARRNRLLRVDPVSGTVEFLALELPPVRGIDVDRFGRVFATTGASEIFGSPLLTQIRNGELTRGVGGPFRDPVGLTIFTRKN